MDTMNLDGETNLKERFVFGKGQVGADPAGISGELVCDPPHESLDEWDGNVHFEPDGEVVNAGIKNLLLRGCFLRNVEHCVGLAVYVGPESKIMMNAKKPPKKISRIMT